MHLWMIIVLVINDTDSSRILRSPSFSLEQTWPSDSYVYERVKRQEVDYDEDLDETSGEGSGSGQMEDSADFDLGSAVLESYQGSGDDDSSGEVVGSGSVEVEFEDQIETPLMHEDLQETSGSGEESENEAEIVLKESESDISSGSEVPDLPDYVEESSGSGDSQPEQIGNIDREAELSTEDSETEEIGSTPPITDASSGDDETISEIPLDPALDGSAEEPLEAEVTLDNEISNTLDAEASIADSEMEEEEGSADDLETQEMSEDFEVSEANEEGSSSVVEMQGIGEDTEGSGELSEGEGPHEITEGSVEDVEGDGPDEITEGSGEESDANEPEAAIEELPMEEELELDNSAYETEDPILGSGEFIDDSSGAGEVEIGNDTTVLENIQDEDLVVEISSGSSEIEEIGSGFQIGVDNGENLSENGTFSDEEYLQEILNNTIVQDFEDSLLNATSSLNETDADLFDQENPISNINETSIVPGTDPLEEVPEDDSMESTPEFNFTNVSSSLFDGEFCQNLTFGCCTDLITPAHGPNQEGCCLGTEFGCCPDNIIPASGSNGEGCTCSESPFGCCPDGERSALGPQLAGCGCQNTPFGCCPDDYTSAQGENFKGCSCATFEHGCCPDGVTVAKGPNLEGCPGCETSEHGCCPDEFTAAEGPYNLGCECAGSKFGCCPDGVSEALDPMGEALNETETSATDALENEDFVGCGEIPGAACQLEKDPGTCKENFTVKWFFDLGYGSCSRFWWSGCGGNINRFNTENECKTQCIKLEGKGRCYLPKVTGPCKGSQSSWYFDMKWNKCMPFLYGGCLGNSNRFKSKVECQETCLNTRTEELDVCSQPKEPGPCRGLYPRFYYDQKEGMCQEFNYTGCQGNKNRFSTIEACQNTCQHKALMVQAKKSCNLPKMSGPCEDKLAKWWFNSKSMSCELFYYSGCGGNKNQFDSLQECQRSCPNAFPPELEVKAKLLVVEEDQEAWLQISVEANPPPTVKWFFNKEPVLDDERVKKIADGSLKIMPAQMNDSGIYTVTADNGVGQPARKQITLKVHPSKMPIQVTIPNENSVYKFGQEMVLKCSVKGYPIPIIRWYKNNTPLQKSGRIHLLEDHSLVIDNATPIDGGVYTCRATNKFETVKQDLEIKVEKGDVPKQCVDKPQYANCKLIVKGEFCAKSKYYADFCCKSCTMAGQISPP